MDSCERVALNPLGYLKRGKSSIIPDMKGYPALVGRAEAAKILGVTTQNFGTRGRTRGLIPPSLQERGIAQVSSGPVWLRDEIMALAERLNRSVSDA